MYDLDEAMSILIQHYRHDFLNILQVVGGLAQLQKNDKLLAYVRKASEEVQQFGRFIGCGDARFALILYNELLRDLKGTYLLDVEGSVPLFSVDTLYGFKSTIESLHSCLQALHNLTITIHIIGGQPAKVGFHVLDEHSMTSTFWQSAVSTAQSCGLDASVQPENCEFLLLLG